MLKYIRVVSDIHLDCDISKWHQTRAVPPGAPGPTCDMDLLWFPAALPEDAETVLVIAGDLWEDTRFVERRFPDGESWAQKLARRFKHVVAVLGNHDYWKRNLLYEADRVNAKLGEQGVLNFSVLENDAVVIDQVKFVGATLWTDFNRNDPMVMHNAYSLMNDYRYIRYGRDYRKLTVSSLYERHQNSKKYIFNNAAKDHADQVVVVVTHHAPSPLSVDARYLSGSERDRMANFYYYSDLTERMSVEGADIRYWIHGHTHTAVRYRFGRQGETVCNPRGYDGWDDTGWDPALRLEL